MIKWQFNCKIFTNCATSGVSRTIAETNSKLNQTVTTCHLRNEQSHHCHFVVVLNSSTGNNTCNNTNKNGITNASKHSIQSHVHVEFVHVLDIHWRRCFSYCVAGNKKHCHSILYSIDFFWRVCWSSFVLHGMCVVCITNRDSW